MSNQYGHDMTTALGIPIVAICSYTLLHHIPHAIITTLAFAFAGFMFNGDLDCHSKPYKRWLFLKFVWLPYRYISSHRSFLSHGPIIGTTIRVMWITIPIIIILLQFYPIHHIYNTILLYQIELLYTLVGLEIGAMSHTINDVCSSSTKKLLKW